MSGTSSDPMLESLQQLQPELDAFNNSLAELCRADGNKPETLALRNSLQEYYSKLHKDLLSRYEILKPLEKNQIAVQNVPNVEPEVKQPRKEDEEKKEAKKGEENFGGYTIPKIWPTLVRRRLSAYCRGVNRHRLIKYLIDNRKDHVLIREQLPVALSLGSNGADVVLDAIKGYDFSGSGSRINDGKGFNRRACICLMECLFPVLGSSKNAQVANDVQDKARKMARVWRENMGLDNSLERASKLDIQAFLQLLVTFRIGKDFEQDELCDMLLQIASVREGPALALFLELSPKMPDFVDGLSKNGEWIEAIRYVHAFRIMDKIKPADLLKSYLEDANKAVEDIVKKGGGSTSSLLSLTMREIDAINTVIKVVKEYNLEDTFPLDDLQDKLKTLEKVKEIRTGTGERNFSEQPRKEDGENIEAKKGEESFGGYSIPKILPTVVRRRILAFCNAMNGKRLLNYLMNNRKDHVSIRDQLPAALGNVSNGAEVVLDAIKGYDFSERGSKINDEKESINRRACISLMECLFPVLGSNEYVLVAKDIQDRAREMARLWRKSMGLDKSLESASKVDIQAFLQLLVTFRIGKDFEQDELCEMLLQIASLRESPALALFLSLSPKMRDFVDRLSKNGQWIEAIRYVHAFGIMDKIKPADLLKSYLEDAKKAVEDIVKKGGGSHYSLFNSTTREMDAINTVINVVKEYNLEDMFPLDDLQNKIKRLEIVKEMRTEHNLFKKQKNEVNNKKAAASTPEKKVMVTTLEEKKVADDKSDKKGDALENEQLKRLHSHEPLKGNAEPFRIHGPTDLGFYRLSQRVKYGSGEMDSTAGDKEKVSHNTGLFQNNRGIYSDDRNLSSYHGDIKSSLRQSYGSGHSGTFVTPSPTGTCPNERRGFDGYSSASGYNNINPVGSSFYGTGAMTGALAVSSGQFNYDGKGLQSYTPTFGGVDKRSLESSTYVSTVTNSVSSLLKNNYERAPELNISTPRVYNLSNDGSSMYGSNSNWSSDPNTWNGRRGLDRYMSRLGAGNTHSSNSSVYDSGISGVPSSNVNDSGLQPQNSGFDSTTSNYGSVASAAGVSGKSAIDRYQFDSGLRF